MKLNDEERQIMVSLEYEKAMSFLEQAERIAAMDLWDVVANRLYYSIFHAVSALLIKDGHKVSTHKGTLMLFGQHYVTALCQDRYISVGCFQTVYQTPDNEGEKRL